MVPGKLEVLMALEQEILTIGRQAREAARELATLSAEKKDTALLAMAEQLQTEANSILAANAEDVARAEQNGLSAAMVDRLRLNTSRLEAMAEGIRQVARLRDPVGEVLREWTQPNGLRIRKIRTPIGVIGIIYESRPNVTSDAAVLCLKTGNATVLRGGSESISSNLAIARALQIGGEKAGLPLHAIQLIPTTNREAVRLLAGLDQYIDLLIPRGGHALIEAVVSAARMPVIKHFHGVCHVYVDRAAHLEQAARIAFNAKCQRPSACNSMETLLVHQDVAAEFLPRVAGLLVEKSVELRGDERTREILGSLVKPATEDDWTTEYLDYILSVKVVKDLDEAMAHLHRYGSHHSDAIVTEDAAAAERFLQEVDSATVYWNASTRFTDGGEFGFGAEIGISTDKLHARGPMGLDELTSYKYQIRGQGQVRD